ncbi:MAG: hypothetical protein COB66_05770 [Coxiella sp. (in: Bacteria)]|nr:MAG: hypothetical protein COB66_05770 [Coxiella sp. (in: g-proteobacteria)]
MKIHRSISVTNLFDPASLLVSNDTTLTFYRFLKHHVAPSIRQTQLELATWRSIVLLPKHIREGYLHPPSDYVGNREPLHQFAYDLYRQFIQKNKLSFAHEITAKLFSGMHRHYMFQITKNAFPYAKHAHITHLVAWLNPTITPPEEQVAQIKYAIKQYFTHQGYHCLLHESTGNARSIPDVRHIQILLYPQ